MKACIIIHNMIPEVCKTCLIVAEGHSGSLLMRKACSRLLTLHISVPSGCQLRATIASTLIPGSSLALRLMQRECRISNSVYILALKRYPIVRVCKKNSVSGKMQGRDLERFPGPGSSPSEGLSRQL